MSKLREFHTFIVGSFAITTLAGFVFDYLMYETAVLMFLAYILITMTAES